MKLFQHSISTYILKDLNLLDLMIHKSVEKDATHTKARYNQKAQKEILMDRTKKLRKAVYKIDESMKNKFRMELILSYSFKKDGSIHSKNGNESSFCLVNFEILKNMRVLQRPPQGFAGFS
ncbi:hypothetical protein QFZ77_002186 [Paenibacillus sp. V4I3]|nr:hypothetical protein [Paenibacillus sp. V4I3]MDQ0890542.1 hypothetical protein [Paenibacillus sp. V4I9]